MIDTLAKRGVQFAQESAHTLWKELLPLATRHSKEQEHHQDIPLDLDIEKYLKAEDIGILRCFTARLDGELIGYADFLVLMSMRHKTSLQATGDSLYVAPEHRKGRTGLLFMSYIEHHFRMEGVQVIRMEGHPGTPFIPLLEHRGYELVHLVYEKRLDKGD